MGQSSTRCAIGDLCRAGPRTAAWLSHHWSGAGSVGRPARADRVAETEGDELRYARHLPPAGSYVDGRGVDEQHDPGWSERDKAWFAHR
jgi:hypothetical protein